MVAYVGAEQAMVDLWVKTQIAGKSVPLDGISANLSQRVYLDAAPKTTTYPAIIYQCQDPPRDVRGVGVFSVMVDTLYLVKVVAQVDSYDPLVLIVQHLHDAMTTSVGGSVGEGHVFTSVRQNQFSMPEFDQGVQFRHLGGIYRIQAQG